MDRKEFEKLAGSLEANLGAYIMNDNYKREAWYDAVQYLPLNRCLETVDKMVEIAMGYKQVKAPSVASFMSNYYKKFPKSDKQLVNIMDKTLTCCDYGMRYLIVAGTYPYLKPICLKKGATRFDVAGTVYKAYGLHKVPCTCLNGQNINQLYKNFDYEMQQLQKFVENSFGNEKMAMEYYQEKIQPISAVEMYA